MRKDNYCIDCKKPIWTGSIRCRSCAHRGKLNGKFKNRQKPHCIDCDKIIWYKRIRCKSCEGKRRRDNDLLKQLIPHPIWKRIKYKNIWMRSTWEIAYAKYLDLNKIKWKYEPKMFKFNHTNYTPDFYLPETNTYIEIKGYWRDDARQRFILFKKLHPKIKIKVLQKKDLKCLNLL